MPKMQTTLERCPYVK